MKMDLNSVSVNVSNENENEAESSRISDTLLQTNYGNNAPPSYNETNNIFNPTSNTFFKSLSYAQQPINRSYTILSNLAKLICCSVSTITILAVLMALPIIMVILGFYYLNKCTIQKMIPIWLIVFGVLMLVKNISTLVHRINAIKKGDEKSSSTILSVLDSFMSIFVVVWFVCGNIWVYSIKSQVQHTDPSEFSTFCSKTTYLFSFWFITSIYIVAGFACLTFCFTICLTIFIPTKDY